MISRIHSKLGTAGLIVAIVALVAALSGAAIAAKGGLTGKQKKEVEKIAKKYAGKPGAPGAQGPVGPAGPKGDKGDKGDEGDQGIQGIQGIQGPPGEDGTFSTEPLPENETLTGVWAATGNSGDLDLAVISLPIQVVPAPKAIGRITFAGKAIGYEVKDGSITMVGPYPILSEIDSIAKAEEAETAYKAICAGSAAAPEADPGYLCFYRGSGAGGVTTAPQEESVALAAEAARPWGVTVPFKFNEANSYIRGSWAVTGS